ncbi:thioredoxin family protein [uncultured Algimonas sp.]|uniref:thioredoxin family protein n=1 Tax=uncultured Algimonas sp. TaxID=1547920 RepID=UPI0026120B69|nr:thioredoxin family protein [uncultured Algimonas sp.]
MRTFLIVLSAMLSACATQAPEPAVCSNLPSGDYCAFDATRDAGEDVRIAQEVAAREDLKTLIVMGANWCHDSRALAGTLRGDRFTPLLAEHYRLVYVDVGRKNRNLDIARRFGLDDILGTPTVIIADSDGTVLNRDTAPTWRNAASRTEDEIYDELERFAEME